MRIKHGARDHDVIFVAFTYQPHPIVLYPLQPSTDKQQPLEKLSNELIVLASRSTTVRGLVKSVKVTMAEAIGSGGESSEEDDHDEDIPSRRGPVSSNTAASRSRHPNQTKELRYFQDYLPKHQRRRIQKEIDNGFKPGEAS